MRSSTASLALALSILACGCARKAADTATPSTISSETPRESAAQEESRHVPSPAADGGYTDWIALSLHDAGSPSTALPAFEAYGYRIGTTEYQAALKNHLAGAPETPAARSAFERLLRERLMLLAWLERSPLPSNSDFRAQARARLRADLADSALASLLAAQSPPVPESEVRALYEQRKSRYRTPEMARIRMVQVGTEEEAGSVRQRLLAGEDFGKVARELSRHASRTSGGEIDPFPRGTLGIRELEDLAFRLEPGDLGNLETPSGYFVVKKIGSLPEQVKPFSAVEAELRAELQSARDAKARTELLGRIEREIQAP